uniref:Ferritin n=1 Tax=Vombatus ursinus TaxID=29139 RepID=A0A4X2LRU9_VOMUR
MTTLCTSQVRQNYHQDSEAAINRQINLELYTSYVYLSMAYNFDRDVALKNFAKYFLHQCHEERERDEKLMNLQNQRGGRIFLQDIKKPDSGGKKALNNLSFFFLSSLLSKNVMLMPGVNPDWLYLRQDIAETC